MTGLLVMLGLMAPVVVPGVIARTFFHWGDDDRDR